jgi:hypothetical protein
VAETPQLSWDLEVTIEVRITMTKKVIVKNQSEAAHHCEVLSNEARAKYPSGYIGCGVIAVRMANDADKQRELMSIAQETPTPGVAPR